MSDRTLAPTVKRRQEARKQGRVAASSPLVGAITWLGVAVMVAAFGARAVVRAKDTVEAVWSSQTSLSQLQELSFVREAVSSVVVFVIPVLAVVFLLAVLGRLAQVGFLWIPDRILPKFDRIQPGQRFTELLSMEKFITALCGVAIFAAMGAVLWCGIWCQREAIVRTMLSEELGRTAVSYIANWGLQIGACLFVIGLLDYGFQLYRLEQSLYMTPEELRSEIQAVQANPQIGAGRRSLQQELRAGRENVDRSEG